MQNLSLDYFNLPQGQKYHIYRISGSEVGQQPHTHDFYQICFVDRGGIEHWQDDAPVLLNAGDAFIVPPGFVHKILFPDSSASIYSLSFAEDLFHSGFARSNVYHFMTALKIETLEEQRIPIRMKVVLDNSRRQTLRSLMDALIREQESSCPPELTAAASLVASILCILSQGYFLDNQQQLQDVTRYNQSIADCISYIDTHFTQPLTMGELTKKFALSRSKFSLLFPQCTGMTLKRYIAQKRIDYALMLIQSTSLPIQEISEMCGYEDVSTFYRNFTKITGTQPSAYRPTNGS